MQTTSKTQKPIGTTIAKIYGILIIIGIIGAGLYVLNYLSILWDSVFPLWLKGEGREEIQIPLQRGDEAKIFLSAYNQTQLLSLPFILLSGWFAHLSCNHLQHSKGTILPITLTILFGAIFIGLQIYNYIDNPVFLDTAWMSSPLHMTILFYMAGVQGYALLAGIVYFLLTIIFIKLSYVTKDNPLALKATVWHWYFVVGLWCLIFAIMLWRSYLWGL